MSRALALAVVLAALGACNSGADAPVAGSAPAVETGPAPPPAATSGASAARQEPAAAAPGDHAKPPPEPTVVGGPHVMPPGRLWIGLYCTAGETQSRDLAFYLDGAEVQRLDVRCRAEQPGSAVDRPPDAQFTRVVDSGVHTLRLQDFAGDFVSDDEVAVSGDTWVLAHHRVVGGGGGFMTTVDARYEPPRYATP